jgi:hypothetical protein
MRVETYSFKPRSLLFKILFNPKFEDQRKAVFIKQKTYDFGFTTLVHVCNSYLLLA